MSAQVAADLRAAADVLERDGWTQGHYECKDGSRCVVGALNHIAGKWTTRWGSAYTALWDSLGDGPTNWNDTRGRTATEVIATLRAAADAADAAEVSQ